MAGLTARILGLFGCLLALLIVLPAHADPFFVRVYGRTYKIDPRYPSGEPKGPKPQDAMNALPSDIGKGPGFRPTHEQVLAEVEERLWIAQNQLDNELEEMAGSRAGRNTGADTKAIKQQITGLLATGSAQAPSQELRKLYDRYRALNLLARELRRSLDLPVAPSTGFSRPKLTPEIEASYRDLNFDSLAAYYGFRRVKAAFRSGDRRTPLQRRPLPPGGHRQDETDHPQPRPACRREGHAHGPTHPGGRGEIDLRDGLRAGQGDDAWRRRGLDQLRQDGLRTGNRQSGMRRKEQVALLAMRDAKRGRTLFNPPSCLHS